MGDKCFTEARTTKLSLQEEVGLYWLKNTGRESSQEHGQETDHNILLKEVVCWV